MKKRIFTAIDLSEEARGKVSDYIQNFSGEFSGLRVGWEKAEKLHLTLKFLGDCDERQLDALKNAVLNTVNSFSALEKVENFKICISNTGVFPAKRNARILWLGLRDESGNLAKINQILEAECGKAGFEREKRGLKPHLTIARLREPHRSKDLIEKHLKNKFEPVEFCVSGIAIYESKLQPTGSIYQKLKELKFSE